MVFHKVILFGIITSEPQIQGKLNFKQIIKRTEMGTGMQTFNRIISTSFKILRCRTSRQSSSSTKAQFLTHTDLPNNNV
jgi:hypothetical protein